MIVISIFSLIVPTPRECCEAASVPEFCLGLCSPPGVMARQEKRITACSNYDAVIEKCFQGTTDQVMNQGPLMQGNITIHILSFVYHLPTFKL